MISDKIIWIIVISLVFLALVTLLLVYYQVPWNSIAYLLIILVGLGVLYVIVISYHTKRMAEKLARLNPPRDFKKKYDLLHIIVILFIGLTFLIYLTVETEYIPKSSSQQIVPFNNSSFENITKFDNVSLVIESPSLFLVPINSVFNPVKANINVSIYNLPKNVKIQSIKLFAPSDSFITIPQTELKNDSKKSGYYSTSIEARHSGNIFRINNTYTVGVSLNDTNKMQSYNGLIPFKLNVKSLDVNIVTYFWIVMIGVVASRFISFVLEEVNNIQTLDKNDPQYEEKKTEIDK